MGRNSGSVSRKSKGTLDFAFSRIASAAVYKTIGYKPKIGDYSYTVTVPLKKTISLNTSFLGHGNEVGEVIGIKNTLNDNVVYRINGKLNTTDFHFLRESEQKN